MILSNKTDVSIVYIPKTKNSSFFKTFLMKKHGVAVLFDFESINIFYSGAGEPPIYFYY